MMFPLLSSVIFFATALHGAGASVNDDDWDPFGGDFEDSLNQMDKEERMYNRLDAGFANWEERCLKIGGQEALDNWVEAQSDLVLCVLENFNKDDIKKEAEAKKETGDLDLVFKKYCDDPVKQTRPCVEHFLHVSRQCLKPRERPGLNVTLRMIDAAVQFICHNNGDRLALFMFEDGLGCVENRSEAVMDCINRTVPEIAGAQNSKNIHLILFSNQNCKKGNLIRQCIESELLKCPDPTPANVVNSMMLAMREATPCKAYMSSYTSSSPSAATPSAAAVAAAALAVLALATTSSLGKGDSNN